MIPWTCDALLDIEERHASAKFRRFRGVFDAERVAYDDAAELVAFLHAVPPHAARQIFGWGQVGVREANRLLKHLSGSDDVVAMVEQNALALTKEDGLKCLRAMQEGGWTNGPLPPMVRMSLLAMLDEGMSRPAIGRAVGLTVDQVRVCMGRSKASSSRGIAKALLAL